MKVVERKRGHIINVKSSIMGTWNNSSPATKSTSESNLVSLCGELSFGPNDKNDVENTPRLVYSSSTTEIYRYGEDKGIKFSSQERIGHEERISHHLPLSCPRQKIFNLEQCADGGRFSYHFEWVNGVTLAEWLTNQTHQRNSQETQLKTRLRVAIAIAKTVGEYHDAGVAHNKLSVSNIIVETFEQGGYCAISLIDLSEAVLLNQGGQQYYNYDSNNVESEAARRVDLKQLGRVFQRLFGRNDEITFGQQPHSVKEKETENYDRDYEVNSRKKRGKTSRDTEGIPMYLTSMIAALINQGTDCSNDIHGETYESISLVLSDLKIAATKFSTYLGRNIDYEEASLLNHLSVPHSAFYGRQSELSVLRSSLHAVISSGNPMMTVVAGHAGIG